MLQQYSRCTNPFLDGVLGPHAKLEPENLGKGTTGMRAPIPVKKTNLYVSMALKMAGIKLLETTEPPFDSDLLV